MIRPRIAAIAMSVFCAWLTAPYLFNNFLPVNEKTCFVFCACQKNFLRSSPLRLVGDEKSLLCHTVSTLTVASFRTWRGSATFRCTGLDLKELFSIINYHCATKIQERSLIIIRRSLTSGAEGSRTPDLQSAILALSQTELLPLTILPKLLNDTILTKNTQYSTFLPTVYRQLNLNLTPSATECK